MDSTHTNWMRASDIVKRECVMEDLVIMLENTICAFNFLNNRQ